MDLFKVKGIQQSMEFKSGNGLTYCILHYL